MTCTYSETKRVEIFGYLTQFTEVTLKQRNEFINDGSIIVVNGNIGVGKSSLCKNLATHFNENGKPAFVAKEMVMKVWLEKYYENPKKWAGEFQNNQLNLCTNAINVAHARCDTENKIAIVDRSPTGNACFFLANLDNIDQDHRDLYVEGFLRCGPYLRSKAVYLDACVDTIYARIQQRIQEEPNRASEKGISKEYLYALDEMMILVELFLYYKTKLPIMFLRWEDYSADPKQIAQLICDSKNCCKSGLELGSPNSHNNNNWKEMKNWLLKASYKDLKERVRILSVIPTVTTATIKTAVEPLTSFLRKEVRSTIIDIPTEILVSPLGEKVN